LAIDRHGRLAVAHFGMGVVWIFSPKGEAMLRINIPGGDKVTNIAFDENEGKTLFITEADSASVYVANLDELEI
jgi:gluconolactonase